MRKQYHFWPGPHGLDAWDVHRLILLAADLPVVDVPLAEIHELDTAYWALPGAEHPTVRELVGHVRLILDVDPSYPIILGPDGRVMDGMHRIARALLEGRMVIPAVRFPVLPDPDHRDVQPDELPYDEVPDSSGAGDDSPASWPDGGPDRASG
jgi:hypothetical protein